MLRSPPAELLARVAAGDAAARTAASQWMRRQLVDGPTASTPSITTRLPFPYHRIPACVRMRVRDAMVARWFGRLRGAPRFPDYYADNGLDAVASAAGGAGPAWSWPEGHQCALMLSHDVDTGTEHEQVRAFADLARSLGLRSTFMFVGDHVGRYADLCHELLADGFEVGLHDVVHDNRIAWLGEDAVVDRLRPWLERWQGALGVRGFRSPSWYVSPALWRGLRRAGLGYDCSVQDTNMMQEGDRNVGAATYFPYMVGDLVVLPSTIPFDELPWAIGVEPSATATFWQAKIDHVAATGGVMVVNAHPSPWFCGNTAGRDALRTCLEQIVSRHAPWCATGRQIEAHVRREAERGAMATLTGEPPIGVPRHGREIRLGGLATNPVTRAWRS
jgi:peptidoglycan/xylan/chitin deacetylase (PgdA/CDA1 family)